MRRPVSVLTALILGLPLAAGLRADTITLTGTTIAISDCSVQALRGGEIFYRDARGKLYRRPLEDVSSLGFTGLPALDEAESAIAAGRLDEGLQRLLQAMLETENDLQRLWLHARLCRLHDERGEFVSAAGHAAIVWSLSNDVSWRILEPMTPLDEASPCTYAAAVEALAALQHAQAKIKQPVLLRLTERLITRVQPLCDALGRDYSGPPIDPEGTISGVSKRRIRQGDRAASDTGVERPPPFRRRSRRSRGVNRSNRFLQIRSRDSSKPGVSPTRWRRASEWQSSLVLATSRSFSISMAGRFEARDGTWTLPSCSCAAPSSFPRLRRRRAV